MSAWRAALIAIAVPILALAQQNTDQRMGAEQRRGSANDRTGTMDQRTEATPPIAGGTLLGVEVRELAVIATGYRVSKLLGEQVYNDKNEKIGKVEDFIVKPDGTLSYAILEVGGFLKMGAHRVAIPLGQFTSMRPKVVLPGATKEALKQMPEFTYAKSQS